ncbi:hypothetical protein PF005_g550 [Phytophthora fragariae]|uniref:Uncharacterized protein n=1 Tax=Phytophthora fragariae TaxID=53985 RepID=A0A6A3ZJ56_9STRA|nr:hypothetical protein PF009_g604 [Phytophthora fragariae]KAE9140459.1 hypothetical protein PF007_g637 [Phytophthora fragariae]KAE9153210.1 hypothetical protein PF006_g2643 [Phytophthora fragariae]KAE9237660.1 hypothetical protein PF005_g550 [Phytophthora fragariae]KAE9255085.1 hypothetical protein PF004_g754 [Phytophthora fragariae]
MQAFAKIYQNRSVVRVAQPSCVDVAEMKFGTLGVTLGRTNANDKSKPHPDSSFPNDTNGIMDEQDNGQDDYGQEDYGLDEYSPEDFGQDEDDYGQDEYGQDENDYGQDE